MDVIFDDLEEDAMVGPLLGDDQLIMEHGGDEEGDTEVPAHLCTTGPCVPTAASLPPCAALVIKSEIKLR